MKYVKNGKGTCLDISEGKYIEVSKDGESVQIRANGKVLAFDTDGFSRLFEAIDKTQADYQSEDN